MAKEIDRNELHELPIQENAFDGKQPRASSTHELNKLEVDSVAKDAADWYQTDVRKDGTFEEGFKGEPKYVRYDQSGGSDIPVAFGNHETGEKNDFTKHPPKSMAEALERQTMFERTGEIADPNGQLKPHSSDDPEPHYTIKNSEGKVTAHKYPNDVIKAFGLAKEGEEVLGGTGTLWMGSSPPSPVEEVGLMAAPEASPSPVSEVKPSTSGQESNPSPPAQETSKPSESTAPANSENSTNNSTSNNNG
jgi:hypothetical protein